MGDVIFDASDSQESNDQTEEISKNIHQDFQDYFNNLQWKVFTGIANYHTAKDEWPTYRELAKFMDEDKNNVQPRLNYLRNRQFVTTAEKRECQVSDHDRKVSTYKTLIDPEELSMK